MAKVTPEKYRPGTVIEGNRFFGVKSSDVLEFTRVNFECRYLADVSVSSEKFKVSQTEVSHSLVGEGSLKDAINLALYNDPYNQLLTDQFVYIGSRIYSSIDILVDSLKDKVDLMIEDCQLVIGETPVSIISESCYASVLGVHREKSEPDQSRFSFISMASVENSAEGESNRTGLQN